MWGLDKLKEQITLLTSENKVLKTKNAEYIARIKQLEDTIVLKQKEIISLESKIDEINKSIEELFNETSSDDESEEDNSSEEESTEETKEEIDDVLQPTEFTPIEETIEEESEIIEEDELSELVTSEGYHLFKEQADCYYAMENNNDNLFITGKAGTGKSTILKYFRDHTHKNIVVIAPTGIAAINVNGQTIHSMFKLRPIIQDTTDFTLTDINSATKQTLKALNTIIIDEVSMVRSDVMDMINTKLKKAKGNGKPFGGCQIIAFGDLYQLPPIIERDENVQRWFKDHYDSEYFFSSNAVKNGNFKIIELEKVHRQNDKTFINVLNAIRLGENSYSVLDTINKRVTDYPKDIPIVAITPTRESAEKINNERLDAIDASKYIYTADISGRFKPEDTIADMELDLKVGAQVMMIKNDANKRWVNGTVGIISDLSNYFVEVEIKGHKYIVQKETWTKTEYVYNEEKKSLEQQTVGSFTQYPVKLAYAITIHKSQGQTLENVIIDYSNGGAFANGQTYVALSRAKSLEGLYLTSPISAEDIKVDPRITKYMEIAKRFYENSKVEEVVEENAEEPIKFSLEDLLNCFSVSPIPNPKKITGHRISSVLNKNKYETPLAAWAAMMRIHEEPFDDSNPFLTAGRFVESKQINYVKENVNKNIQNPDEYYQCDAKKKTGYDFFKDEEVFGGMWDAVEVKDGKIVRVYEMKTTSTKHKDEWENGNIPENYKLQGCLYAYLLGIDDVTFVVTFIEGKQYRDPAHLVTCNKNNTKIINCKVSELYPEFEEIIGEAKDWWRDHIMTGKAPKIVGESDMDLLVKISEM